MRLHKAASPNPELRVPVRSPFCSIRTSEEGRARVVHVEGELDLFDCPGLDRALLDAEGSHATLVVLDCDELRFIDAAGLHSFFAASVRSASDGDRLRITRGGRGVAKMFELTGLDAVLPLVGARNGS